jgi:hypothetical protein
MMENSFYKEFIKAPTNRQHKNITLTQDTQGLREVTQVDAKLTLNVEEAARLLGLMSGWGAE